MMVGKTVLAFLAALLLGTGIARAETVVIVHRDNPATAISKTDLELIYLGKKKMFDDGVSVVPADLPPEHPARLDFFSRILNKSEESYRLYWVRMIFSGKGQPPVSLKSEEEAARWVAANRGGLAFIDSARVSPGVKTVHISRKE